MLKKEFVLGAKEVELLVKIKVDLILRKAIATELQLASGGEFLVFEENVPETRVIFDVLWDGVVGIYHN